MRCASIKLCYLFYLHIHVRIYLKTSPQNSLQFYVITYGFIFCRSETAEHFVQKAHKDYTLQKRHVHLLPLKSECYYTNTHKHKIEVIIFYIVHELKFSNLFMVDQNVIVHAHINIMYSTMNMYESISALLQSSKKKITKIWRLKLSENIMFY